MNRYFILLKKIISLFVIILACHHANATTYYFSSKGNDKADGKSKSTPWRSLNKISETPFVPGDSILLERGSTFEGQLVITHSTLFIGVYGTSAKPVVKNSIALTNWKAIGKNIWKTNCLTEPGDLFMNGKSQPLGRYPNSGYLLVTGTTKNKTTIGDTVQHFPNGYWNDAEIVVRSSRWTLDNLPVKEYNPKTFVTSLPATYDIQPGFRYFIQRHISTLDQSGEWFFSPTSHEIFLFLNTGTNPNDHQVEVSTNDTGLILKNVHDIVIENLEFRHQRSAGVHIEKCNSIRIHNIDIYDSGKNGIEIISCLDTQIRNSIIADSHNNGVILKNSEVKFVNNSILRTGLHAGRGASGNGTYIALAVLSDGEDHNILIEENKIDSTGYIGIDFRSGNTLIRNNRISNFCIVKDDGAGIYTWHNTRGTNTIEGNTINGTGAAAGTVNSTELFISGIYIDDQSQFVTITNNNISLCSASGIFLHNAKNITLTGNTASSNGYSIANKEKGQLHIKLDNFGEMPDNSALHLEISKNKWIADFEGTPCVFLSAKKKQDLQKLGTFQQNEFITITPRQAVSEIYDEAGICLAPWEFTLADWNSSSGYENDSFYSPLKTIKTTSTIGKNLVSNGDMTFGNKGWIAWPDKSTLTTENKIADGPWLKANIAVDKKEILVYHAGFPLSKNKLYRLTFTVVSSVPGKLEFVPLMASSPWQVLGPYTCFSIDSTIQTFTHFFKATKDFTNARVNFKSNSTFWISHVSLLKLLIQSLTVQIFKIKSFFYLNS